MSPRARSPAGSRTPCSWVARLPTRTLEKIAPKMAVPNEPPMDRKNVAPEVATPSSLCGTAFCTMMTSTCITPPMPMPRISMYSQSSTAGVPTPMRDSRYRPTAVTADPAIGKNRYLPVREIIWPDPIDTISSPAISGRIWTPDSVGETPLTTWKNTGR